MSKLLGFLIAGNIALGGYLLYDKGIISVPEIPTVQQAVKEAEKAIVTKALAAPSFAYYTSQVDPEKVASTGYPLVIVNEADKNSRLFTKEDISVMKKSGKTVLAEVSVGYAENYRWYWKKEWFDKKPSFLGEQFVSNQFFVKEFWNPEWMEISKGIIDKAMDAGYDGVVLEGIDVYIELGGSKELRDRMVDYVIAISQYAKQRNPNFYIVAKNAEILGAIPSYRDAVDAIVKEDLVYASISSGTVGPKNDNAQIVKGIRDLRQFGKPVFVIEYVSGKFWDDAKARIKNNGFIGYSAPSRTPSSIRENIW